MLRSRTHRSHGSVEKLENRVLFALVEVTDFGAVPDDGDDDRGAIQSAVDAARPGDTVRFAPGVYEIDGHVTLRRGIRLDGQTRAATLKHTGDDDSNSILYVDADDVTIEALRIEGQVKAENASDFTFTRNYITNDASGAFKGNGLYMPGRVDGSTITWNHFDDISHRGIYFLNQNRMTIEDNVFTDAYQAVSGTFFGESGGSSVSWNTVSGFKRHGIELQNGEGAETEGLRVEGNYVHSPDATQGSMFLSLAMGSGDDRSSRGMVVRGNVLIANGNIPEKLDKEWKHKKYMVTAFELMGTDFLVEDNYAAGFGWYQLVGNNGGEWVSRNNTFVGTDQIPANGDTKGGIGGAVAPEAGYRAEPDVLDNRIENMRSIDDLNDIPGAGVRRDGGFDRSLLEVAIRDPNVSYLSDMSWASAVSGWGPVEIDTNNGETLPRDGTQLKVNGRRYEKGLGVAGNSIVEYQLDGKYDRFQSSAGIDDVAGRVGSMVFQVYADGKKVFDSGILTGLSNARPIDVSLKGVKTLRLVTTDAGDGGQFDHGDWGGARVIRSKS